MYQNTNKKAPSSPQFEDRFVQMGIFFLSRAVIDRATVRKNAQMGKSNSNW